MIQCDLRMHKNDSDKIRKKEGRKQDTVVLWSNSPCNRPGGQVF